MIISYFILKYTLFISLIFIPSMTLGFKFQLMTRREFFLMWNILKYIQSLTVKTGQQHVKD